MPDWLLPAKLPTMRIKGKIQHAPMLDARSSNIFRINERRKEEREARIAAARIPTL